MSVAPPSGQDRIMIYGPKSDGTYIIEFRMADGESLAISVPAGETCVLKHFQARMPYGLVVPDVNAILFDKRSREAVLMSFGLATAQAERFVAGGRTVEVVRMKITDAGRQALT